MSQRYYTTSLGRIPTGPSIPITASDGDSIMLRYEWPGVLGGRDADTFTGIEPGTGTNVDGIKNASGSPTRYVGYAGATTIGPSADINNSGCYFYFGGDNVQTTGQEVVIVRPKSIASANPSITTFRVGIYLNWFSAIGIGCMNFVMRVYSGGSFTVIGGTSKEITSSGTLLRTYTFNANTSNQNNPNANRIGYPSNGINGYAQVGIFTFFTNGNGIFRYNLSAVGNCNDEISELL